MSDAIPEMNVPGFGLRQVLRVYGPDDPLPSDNDDTLRFLVLPDGSAYQTPVGWEPEELTTIADVQAAMVANDSTKG